MVALLPAAELQFIDSNGHPYAGGALWTFIPGTTTFKNTYSDPNGTVLNTNPITLDTAGRCIVYGDGAYRTQLFDALGNLVFDQQSSTLVSAAMAPVVAAPDLPTALNAMGVTAAIAVETARAEAAEAALQNTTATAATTTALTNETTRATAAEGAITSNLNAEITRATAAEAALATTNKIQAGVGNVNSDGHVRIDFTPPFTSLKAVTTTVFGATGAGVISTVSPDVNGFDCFLVLSYPPTTPSSVGGFFWIAVGT